MTRVYIVDTSYLLELYRVDLCFSETAAHEVASRFTRAVESGCRLVVTVGCILETGNHIADVPNGDRRRALALRLRDDVRSAIADAQPWTVVPAPEGEALSRLVEAFVVSGHAGQGLGLVDSQIIEEARRQKSRYGAAGLVHIWTKDARPSKHMRGGTLKSYEPDTEPDPYLG